jgi:hypothetical protein
MPNDIVFDPGPVVDHLNIWPAPALEVEPIEPYGLINYSDLVRATTTTRQSASTFSHLYPHSVNPWQHYDSVESWLMRNIGVGTYTDSPNADGYSIAIPCNETQLRSLKNYVMWRARNATWRESTLSSRYEVMNVTAFEYDLLYQNEIMVADIHAAREGRRKVWRRRCGATSASPAVYPLMQWFGYDYNGRASR